MSESELHGPHAGDALLLIDVQQDFLPGGSLAVPNSARVIAPLRRCIDLFASRALPVFATRDWHPGDHCSFRTRGGPWPEHCVAGSAGAAFSPALRLPASAQVVSKGTLAAQEAYSGFTGTELERRLNGQAVRRLFIGGLATDYCVAETVQDARRRGFEVVVLRDAIACGGRPCRRRRPRDRADDTAGRRVSGQRATQLTAASTARASDRSAAETSARKGFAAGCSARSRAGKVANCLA